MEDPRFASSAQGVELLGEAVSARLGTRIINGVLAYCRTGSTSSALKVDDTARFAVTDVVQVFSNPMVGGGFDGSRSITAIAPASGAGTLTLNGALSFTPTADVSVVQVIRGPAQTGLPTRMDALAQMTFRNETQVILATAGTKLWRVDSSTGLMPFLTALLPNTTVDVNWGSATSGTLTSVQGLQVGDWIFVSNAGATGNRYGHVVSIVVATRTITVDAAFPFGSNPTTTTSVVIFCPRDNAGNATFLQYGNVGHVAFAQPAGAPTTTFPTPPQKIVVTGSASTATVYRHGIKPPVSAMTVGNSGTGITLVTGRTYRIKFRNSVTGQESEPGPVSASTGPVTNKQIDLTLIPASVDPQVVFKRIYTTTDGGAGVWFFLAEIANVSTSYADTTPDTALSTTPMREFLDNTISDTVSVIALWPQANRLVAIDRVNNLVQYSDQPDFATGRLKGEAWPVNNTIFVSYDDGDQLVGLAAFYDALMVYKRRSVWRITGIPPNLTIEPLIFRADLTGVGAFSQQAIAVDENEMLFAAQDGVYLVNRYAGVQAGFQSQRITNPIEDRWTVIDTAQQANAHAVYYRQRRQFRLWVPFTDDVGAVENMGEPLVYQFDTTLSGESGGWTTFTFREATAPSGGRYTVLEATASAIIRSSGAPDATYVGTSTGLILQLDSTLDAGDCGIIPYFLLYTTIPVAPAGVGIPARVRAVDLVIDESTPALDLFVRVFQDGSQFPGPGIGLPLVALKERYRLVLLARGSTLALSLSSPATGFPGGLRLLQGVLWSQALPAAAASATMVQSVATTYPT